MLLYYDYSSQLKSFESYFLVKPTGVIEFYDSFSVYSVRYEYYVVLSGTLSADEMLNLEIYPVDPEYLTSDNENPPTCINSIYTISENIPSGVYSGEKVYIVYPENKISFIIDHFKVKISMQEGTSLIYNVYRMAR